MAVFAAAGLASIATPLFAAFARWRGLVVKPRGDRWHRESTPLLGGAGMVLAILLVLAIAAPASRANFAIALAAAAAFALGLVDDFRHLAPSTKLVGQVLIASGLAYAGVRLDIGGPPALLFVVTVFWIVALMNAVNLIDNMDGLAAGVTAIAALALGVTALRADPSVALMSAVTAGAAVGFLVHNFYPARVFMGDAGSQMLGLLLSAAALQATTQAAANLGLAVLGSLAVLALPIFDTALVTAARRLAGRPISQGGRDHTSHRLAALGLSDRGAVLVLYAVAGLLAAVGLVAQEAATFMPVLFGLGLIALILFGVFLHEVDVYGGALRRGQPSPPFVGRLFVYMRFGTEIGLDVVLLTIAYYSAWALRFEAFPEHIWIDLFAGSLPIVIGVQLAALVLTGVYRTLWRYLGVSDAMRIVRAATLGTAAAAIAILFGFRFEGYSRAVFVLDWLFAAALLIGARSFLLWLRQWFSLRGSRDGRRVLIVGATENGALAQRLLPRSGDAAYRVVGFLDDDPGKRYRDLGGTPVIGTIAELDAVLARLDIDLVVLALEDGGSEKQAPLRAICAQRGIACRDFLVPV